MAESKIYIQEGVKMQETYTFSRALYMMRYGGKKMRDADYCDDRYVFIKDEELFGYLEGEIYSLSGEDEHRLDRFIDSSGIMGSWVEVHG